MSVTNNIDEALMKYLEQVKAEKYVEKYIEALRSNIYKQVGDRVRFAGFLWHAVTELIKENKRLQEEKQHLETIIGHYNKHYLQRARLKSGAKIAYKKSITIEKILELKKNGLTLEEIAKALGVCRTTIWRRLKEFQET